MKQYDELIYGDGWNISTLYLIEGDVHHLTITTEIEDRNFILSESRDVIVPSIRVDANGDDVVIQVPTNPTHRTLYLSNRSQTIDPLEVRLMPRHTSRALIAAEETIPAVISRDYPKFEAFLKVFFEAFGSIGSAHDLINRFDRYRDVDDALFDFGEDLRKTFLPNFEAPKADLSLLLKTSRGFYARMGTEQSYRYLVRVLHDAACDISMPRRGLLIPSDINQGRLSSYYSCSDNYYHQIMAYVIESEAPFKDIKESIDDHLKPEGSKLFGRNLVSLEMSPVVDLAGMIADETLHVVLEENEVITVVRLYQKRNLSIGVLRREWKPFQIYQTGDVIKADNHLYRHVSSNSVGKDRPFHLSGSETYPDGSVWEFIQTLDHDQLYHTSSPSVINLGMADANWTHAGVNVSLPYGRSLSQCTLKVVRKDIPVAHYRMFEVGAFSSDEVLGSFEVGPIECTEDERVSFDVVIPKA